MKKHCWRGVACQLVTEDGGTRNSFLHNHHYNQASRVGLGLGLTTTAGELLKSKRPLSLLCYLTTKGEVAVFRGEQIDRRHLKG